MKASSRDAHRHGERRRVAAGDVAAHRRSLERGTKEIRNQLADDGPGLPAADLARLLERHARGDGARGRDPEGRGLGLDIVRRVSELHGLSLSPGPGDGGGLEAEISGPLAIA